MQIKGIPILFLSFMSVLFACNKKTEKADTPDIFAPEIKRSSPSTGASFNSLYPINIIGTVTDLRLDSLEIQVYSLSTGKVLLHKFPNVQGENGYIFNESFGYPNLNSAELCACIIKAKDQVGNRSADSTAFIIY